METILTTTKDEIIAGLQSARRNYDIAALTQQHDRVLFDIITDEADILWDYQPSILSPKKFFFPQDEVLLEYTTDGQTVTSKIEARPLVLFGIRPCDANGIKILDEAFGESNGDPNYLAKKEKTVIIAIDCHTICDSNAFCYKVGANHANGGYDIMLKPIHNQFVILPITVKGKDFVLQYIKVNPGDSNLEQEADDIKAKGFYGHYPLKNLDSLPKCFEENKHHPIWEEEGSRCLSCGSCILVCPTCYCFDVADELALNLKTGERLRRWDACMLHAFSTVSGGENFRKKATERLKHRIHRKFNYLMKKHGQSVCVGCGRCVKACLAKISPKQIAQKIVGEIA